MTVHFEIRLCFMRAFDLSLLYCKTIFNNFDQRSDAVLQNAIILDLCVFCSLFDFSNVLPEKCFMLVRQWETFLFDFKPEGLSIIPA